jgi:hypothetical protein
MRRSFEMNILEIKEELKLLNTKKIKIEKLMKKPNGSILNEAWLSNEEEISELQALIDNCDFTVEEV